MLTLAKAQKYLEVNCERFDLETREAQLFERFISYLADFDYDQNYFNAKLGRIEKKDKMSNHISN